MTRRLFLLNGAGAFPRTYGWPTLLAVVVSALLLFGSWPGHVHAQSAINTPTSGAPVSGDVPIIGTAVIEPFQRYELYYKLEPSGDDAYIYFDGGTNQVNNGQLAIWRTATLAPGTYSIRLRVVKTDGNYGEFFTTGLVVNQGVAPTPTATPTASEPTPTPIPTATFTPAPQPTPIVGQVTQPQVEGDVPLPTPTTAGAAEVISGSASVGNVTGGDNDDTLFATTSASAPQEATTSFTRELGEAVALNRLRSFFFTGMRVSAILILGSVILLAGRRIFSWVWTQYR